MNDLFLEIARLLHVAWLFPMTSSEVAAWLQGVGTLAAVAVTLHLTRRDRLNRQNESDAEKAPLLTGWITSRTIRRIGVGDDGNPIRVGIISACIKNDGTVTARQVTARLITKTKVPLEFPIRYTDVIAPNGDEWQLEWWISNLDHPALQSEEEVDLEYEYNIHAKLWKQNPFSIVRIGVGKLIPPPIWSRYISAAWNELQKQEANEFIALNYQKDALRAVIPHAVKRHGNYAKETLRKEYEGVVNEILNENSRSSRRSANKEYLMKTEALVNSIADISPPGRRKVWDDLKGVIARRLELE